MAFQKWRQEVHVEEVLTATLPKEHVSSDEEFDLLSEPLLASPPGKEVKKKEVQSSDSEVDLFAPPPTAPMPQQHEKGKKALPSAPPPPVPQNMVKGKKALPSAPTINPSTSKRRTRRTIPRETTPLGVGDWLTDEDILCWLNKKLYHMEVDEPCACTFAVLYIKRASNCMRMVECGSTLDNMPWCLRHFLVVNSDDKQGWHWFLCAFECRVRWARCIIWVWEPLSSIHLSRPFLAAIQKLC